MEQEQVGLKVVDVYRLTGELLLKAMYYTLEEQQQVAKSYLSNKTFTNQTNWNRFMATKETKHFETFMTSEVNAERLKDYLKGYGVGFSIKDNGNGTSTIAIDAKNIQALEASFKGVVNDLTDPQKAEKLTDKLVNTPKNMSLKEKLAYYKKKVREDIKSKAKAKAKDRTPTPKKAKSKDERGI